MTLQLSKKQNTFLSRARPGPDPQIRIEIYLHWQNGAVQTSTAPINAGTDLRSSNPKL